MTRSERRQLTAQLARRLDERPDVPIGQAILSLMRPAMKLGKHPAYLTDEDFYTLLNPPKDEGESAE